MKKGTPYKALFVKNNTHKKIAVEAKKQGITIDLLLLILFKLWKTNKK